MTRTSLLFAVFCIFAPAIGSGLFAQDKSLFVQAGELYAAKKYDEAAEIYKKMLAADAAPNEKAKIIYGLGMSYVQLDRPAEADAQFRVVLSMEVDNREPEKGRAPGVFRNYHYNSQFAIARMQFGAGDFPAALESFKHNRTKYPYLSNCGICLRDEDLKLSLYEAATLEHLNRDQEAFGIYFKISHPRLVEIYAANGRTENLIRLIEKKTRELSRPHSYEDFFRAYELSKAGNAAALMSDLRRLSSTAQDSYLKDWTSRMLARLPREAVPLVEAELKDLKTYPYVYYRTLGFAATPEALEVLKARARRATGWFDAESVVASLMLAGEAGEAALRELEAKTLSRNMKLAVEKYKKGEIAARNYVELDFAPLRKPSLPDDF